MTKSASFSTSSTDCARLTCDGRLQAASTVMSGSYPTTFMPSLIAASATRQPIIPRPMTPSVWPDSSKPAKRFLPSSTAASRSGRAGSSAVTKRNAPGRWRAAISMPATTSSLTAFAFAPGALNTGTPRAVIAGTGMLFVPAPARAIASTPTGISAASRVVDRTRIASGSVMSAATR